MTRLSNGLANGLAAVLLAALALVSGAALAVAEPDTKPDATAAAAPAAVPAAAADKLSIELNKMETADKGCRVVMVINNPTDTEYTAMKLDLVMFEGGVFTRRVALDLAPIKPQKRSVKLFDLDGLACDRISELLINDVMECKTSTGPGEHCMKNLSVSSLTKTKLSK